MSTNARIGIENEDGSVTSVYTHFDGYPSHHAPILAEHYSEPEKLRALLALGDLSVLAPELGSKHDFDTHSKDAPDDWCLFYGRDRGETDIDSKTHPIDAWPDYGQRYEYLLRADGWHARPVKYEKVPTLDDLEHDYHFERVDSAWQPLAELLAEDLAEEAKYAASQK